MPICRLFPRPLASAAGVFLAVVTPAMHAQTPAPAAAALVHPRTPAEEAAAFLVPPGYKLELVLSEPEIREPVAIAYDGSGRLFVAEMRTYMQDIDGSGESARTSRVSLHWSSKGDGVLDRHTVFADHLLLPRMVLPLARGQCVIGETNTADLYLYTDTDGDGVADKKELWWEGGPRAGNVEHQPGGLVWGLDNACYTTVNTYRLRWTPQGVVKENTAPNSGQWGLGQDDYGRFYFLNAGGEKGPQSFQVPPRYGMFNPDRQFAPGFMEVWPASGLRDYRPGIVRVRESDGTLNHFTGVAGIEVYRGDRLPAELKGSVFFGEPVGRLVRRAVASDSGGLTILSNPYQAEHSEFLRSKDVCFRPVNFANAPDGTLTIVDMYRGIIQHAAWLQPDTLLREMIEKYRLDTIAGHGRIWRLVHESRSPGPAPRMDDETPAQLVTHLAHPSGWWRDTAQKLLVLRQDRSVVPALTEMARHHSDHLARLHALWTLDGLGAMTPELVQSVFADAHPQLRIAAIRLSERFVQQGNADLRSRVLAATKDADPSVVIQAFLTAKVLELPDYRKLIAGLIATNPAEGVRTLGNEVLAPPMVEGSVRKLSVKERDALTAGSEIFNTLCATCHGYDARGLPMFGGAPGALLAPSLVGAREVTGSAESIIRVLLHGIAGDIDGRHYEGAMPPLGSNTDAWVANVASYVRNAFGNRSTFVSPEQVARVREAAKSRALPWSATELRALTPPLLERKNWKARASENSADAANALDGDAATRFTMPKPQHAGQWFQVDLPAEREIDGFRIDAAGSPNDFPGGYQVAFSTDGKKWTKAAEVGLVSGPFFEVKFEPVRARSVRISLVRPRTDAPWSIHEVYLSGPGK